MSPSRVGMYYNSNYNLLTWEEAINVCAVLSFVLFEVVLNVCVSISSKYLSFKQFFNTA